MDVASARTELDLDPFGAPIDARTYVDYKNVSNRPIAAVKFRIRFYDAEGKDRGTFHAPDARLVEPGGQGSQKWKTERVDPRIVTVKMRALEVKFADGSSWQSTKLPELVQPAGADGGGAVPGGGAFPGGSFPQAGGPTTPAAETPGTSAPAGAGLPGSSGAAAGGASDGQPGTASSSPKPSSSSGTSPAPAAASDPFGDGEAPPTGDKQ